MLNFYFCFYCFFFKKIIFSGIVNFRCGYVMLFMFYVEYCDVRWRGYFYLDIFGSCFFCVFFLFVCGVVDF